MGANKNGAAGRNRPLASFGKIPADECDFYAAEAGLFRATDAPLRGNGAPQAADSGFSDPFAGDCARGNESPRAFVTLYELNTMVRVRLAAAMKPSYWLAAEVSELRVASNGHCYLEFVEADANGGGRMAKARGNIWRDTYNRLAARFEHVTGARLAAGMKVLVEVSVTFHELYGFSLNVLDIDPAYTLGDAERRRREILRQLDDDGVLHLNKELLLPRPLWRIAVVSAAGAAGYGDFLNQLEQTEFRFKVRLFPAVLQGEKTERSVIAALDAIAEEADAWDAVAIIRGGGAVSDLSSFDTYLLAANVALFPLPVLSGIGHERDDTVVDAVAHTRLKTPTAVAAFLIDRQRAELEALKAAERRLNAAVGGRMALERARLDRASVGFKMAVERGNARRHAKLQQLSAQLKEAVRSVIYNERQKMVGLPLKLTAAAHLRLQRERQLLEARQQVLPKLLTARLQAEKHRLQLAARTADLVNPARILALGYSVTLKDGRPVRSADALSPGDKIVTRLAKGEVASRVE